MTSLLDNLFRFEALEQQFSEEACIQSMLDFEAALARAEAKIGVIPHAAAHEISEKCLAHNFDLSLIARQAALAGNLAIPLIKQLTALVAKEDKDAARFVHWGATSQDLIDTGCILQLRCALELMDRDLQRLTE